MEDFAGLVTKPKLCLGSEDCGLRSVLLSPCHCAGTLAALSSEAGGGFCSSELALVFAFASRRDVHSVFLLILHRKRGVLPQAVSYMVCGTPATV